MIVFERLLRISKAISHLHFAFLPQQAKCSRGEMSGQKPHMRDCNGEKQPTDFQNIISISEDLFLMEDDKFHFTYVEFETPSSRRS